MNIEKLNAELLILTKGEMKALEEKKEGETMKFKEIFSLQHTMKDLKNKNAVFDDEVVKLRADIVSRDLQLKESHVTIASMTDSKLNREKVINDEMKHKDMNIEKLNSELLISKKGAMKALEEKKDGETLKFKEINSLQDTTKDLRKKNNIFDDEIVKLKADIVSRDTQLKENNFTILSMIDSKLDREKKLQSVHSQTQLLTSFLNQSKTNHSKEVAVLKLEIDQMRTCSENKAIAFQEYRKRFRFVAKKAESVEQQEQCKTCKDKPLTSEGRVKFSNNTKPYFKLWNKEAR